MLTTLCFSVNAQQVVSAKKDSIINQRAQNVFVELGGPGLLFSANYDTRFSNKADGLGGRIGLGFISSSGSSLFTLPLQLNYLLGKNNKYFEIGLGATYASYNGSDLFSFDSNNNVSESHVFGNMTFGYRYQPIEGGFNFRAAITPLFDSSSFIPYYFGISFGYTFK